jgi:hypothetical protein
MEKLLQSLYLFVKGIKAGLLAFALIVLTTISYGQQVQLHQENFETDGDGSRYTSATFHADSDAFYERLQDNDSDLKYTPTGHSGSYIWVTGKVDVGGNTNNPVGILTIDNIDISNHTSLNLQMLIGAVENQYDNGDYLLIEANIDGGGYSTIGAFYENGGGELRQDADLSGDDEATSPTLANLFSDFTFDISGTGDLLDLRITTTNDSGVGNEQTSFDNIRVFGTQDLATGANAITATYSFGSGATVDSQPTGVTFSDFSAGSGLSVSAEAGFYRYDSWASAPTIGVNDYYEFTITPDAGSSIDLATIYFDEQREHASSPSKWELRSSIDAYASSIGDAKNTTDNINFAQQVNLTGVQFADITDPITFRLYAYDQITDQNNNRYWKIDNVVVNGSVTGGSLLPANGGGALSSLAQLKITYFENVIAGVGNITVYDATATSTLATYDVTSATEVSFATANAVTVDVSALTFVPGNTIEVSVDAGAFVDGDPTDNTAITGATDWSFTIDDTAPTITADPIVSPSSGTSKVGDVVTVTLIEATSAETGLSASSIATINGVDVSVSFADIGGGSYTYSYTLVEGNTDWASGGLTINLGLQDAASNESTTITLNANTLIGDANTPAAPGAPDLDAGSDSNINNDDITNDNTPTFTGTGTNGETINLISSVDANVGSVVVAGGVWSITASTLAEGTHNMTATTTDVAGNTSPASAILAVTIDTGVPTAPSTPDLDVASDSNINTDDITNDNTPTFTGTGTNGETINLISSVDANVGSVVVAGGVWSITASTLAEGTHNITATTTDVAGNTSPASTILAVTIDTGIPTAPSTPDLDAGSDSNINTDDITNDNTPTFSGTGTNGETVNLISSVDANVGSVVVAGGVWSITASTLAEGAHNITAEISDLAGNTGASGILAVTIDTGIPAAPGAPDLDVGSDSNINTDDITNDNTPTFSGTGTNGETINLISSVDANVGSVVVAGGVWSITASTLAEGTHNMTATTTDVAGNTSPASAILAVTIDTGVPTAPAAPDLDAGSDSNINTDDITNDNTPTFSGTGTNGETINLISSVDANVGSVVVAGGVWSITASTLAEGTHNITATTTDVAGNTSPASTILAVTIDTGIPTAPSTPDLDAGSDSNINTDDITNDNTPTFTGTGTNGETVNLISSVDANVGSVVVAGGVWSITASTLAEGAHNITAEISDLAGNTGTSGILVVTIDTGIPAAPGAPDLDAGSDSNINTDDITNDNTPTFSGTGTNGETINLISSVDANVGSVVVAGGVWSITASTLAEGIHNMTATTTDVAGNTSPASAILAVTIDTGVPTAPAAPDLDAGSDSNINTDDITNDNTPTFTGTGTNGETINLISSVDANVGSVVVAGGVWSITASTLAEGTHNITATTTDVAGNTSPASTILAVTIDTGIPTAPSTPDLDAGSDSNINTDDITNDNTPTFSGTGTNGETVNLISSVDANVGSVVVVGGVWSITASTLAEGAHNITAEISDLAGNTGTSGILAVTIDTGIPSAPTAPDLANASDSFGGETGSSGTNTDNVTNDNTPTFEGAAESGSTVRIYSSVLGLVGTGVAGGGTYSITVSVLGDTNHNMTATTTDAAGNTSALSTGLVITIDTQAPSVLGDLTFSDGGGGRETITFTFDETIDLANTTLPLGFSANLPTSTTHADSEYLTAGNEVTIVRNGGTVWTISTTVDYTNGSGNIRDVAGNEMASVTGLPTTDNTPPNLVTGIIFVPNGAGAEQITFNLSEEINLGEGAAVYGFYIGIIEVDNLLNGTAIYSSKGVNNTITLTSNADNAWTDGESISYTQGVGSNVKDISGNELVNIVNQTILLQSVNIVSNNTTTTLAKPGDIITLTFTANAALDGDPSILINGLAPTTFNNTLAPMYTATLTTAGGQPEGLIPISITAVQGGLTTIITATTNHPSTPSSVTFDETAPVTENMVLPASLEAKGGISTPIASSGNINNSVWFAPSGTTSFIANVTTITKAVNGTSLSIITPTTEGTYHIFVLDQAGNISNPSTATLTVDNTAPTINSIVRASGNPHNAGINAGSVDFTVTFSEPVNNVDVTDFSVASSNLTVAPTVASVNASAGTVFTVNVNAFDLNDAAASGTLNLNIKAAGLIDDDAGNDNISAAVAGSDQTYTIINPEPVQDIALLTSSAQTNNNIIVDWTNSIVDQIAYQHLILVKESGVFSTPVDGTIVPSDLALATGTVDQLAIHVGHGVATYNVTGLNSGTSYDFIIYPYTNATSGEVDYKTTTPATLTISTTTASVSTITFNSAPVSIPSMTTAPTGAVFPQLDAVSNFSFIIQDDGIMPGEDNSPMTISDITITQSTNNDVADWSTVIAGAELSAFDADDGLTDVHTGIVNANNITFSGISSADNDLGQIDDNESKTYILKVWLLTTLPDGVDGSDLVFRIRENEITFSNPTTSSKFIPAVKTNSNNNNNVIDVTATQLAWSTQPAAQIGVQANFVTPPVVTAQDANGNRDKDFIGAVGPFTNTDGIVMNNPPTAFPILPTTGILTFSGTFSYNDSGNGTLTLTAGGLTTPESSGVTVSYSDNTTISAGTLPEPAIISSLYTNLVTDADYRFDIDITDDALGVTTDDKMPTHINQIVFNAAALGGLELETNWNDVIANASIFDGANLHHVFSGAPFAGTIGGSISSNSITFSSIPNANPGDAGYIADDATKKYQLYIWFKTNVTGGLDNTMDNLHFNFDIDGADFTVEVASSTLNLAASSITSGVGNNEIQVIATELAYEQQPTTTFINEAMSPIVQVEANDANGNRDRNNTTTIDITSNGLLNPVTVSTTLIAGSNTVSIVHNAVGTLRTLTANENPAALAISTVLSSTFDIDPGRAESEIVANSFAYTDNIDYTAHLGTNVTVGNVKVFEVEIKDGDGITPDADALPTNLTTLGFDIVNFENLEKVALYNGVTEIQEVAAASNIQFNVTEVIPDGGSTLYHLRVTFNTTSITDNSQLQFTISDAIANDQGSTFRFADGSPLAGSAATSSIAGDNNRIIVDHTQLVFDNIVAGSISSDFVPTLIVRAVDANNQLDLDFTENLTAYSNFSTSESAQLATINDPSGSFVAGVFTFPVNYQFTASGNGVTITVETATYDGTPSPAGVSNSFNIISSFDSNVTLVGAPGLTIEYINFLAADISGSANAYELARFSINDGGDNFPDIDGASTIIDQLELTLTNPQDIKRIALYETNGTTEILELAGGASPINFTGLAASLIAPDNSIKEFIVYATFDETTVIDADSVDVSISNIAAATGSQFTAADGGGGAAPNGYNVINVTATTLAFTPSPASIEGKNVPFVSAPFVEALDAQGNRDLDHNFGYLLTSEVATLDQSGLALNFSNGQLDLTNLRYSSAGDGTLSITSNAIAGTSGILLSTDVIHTDATQLAGGIRSNISPLNAGSIDVPIFGFQLNSLTNSSGINEPVLNSVTIEFENTDLIPKAIDIQNVFENFRLFRSGDNSIDLGTFLDESLITGVTIFTTPTSVTINGLNEVLDNVTTNQNLFLVVDVTTISNNLIPVIRPFIQGTDFIISSGSVIASPTKLVGLEYTFVDELGPQIVTLTPLDNGIDIDPTTDLIIEFNEAVTSLDGVITLRKVSDILFNEQIPLFSVSPDSKTFTFRSVAGLEQDVNYYIQIEAGNIGASKGFVDNSNNASPGIQNSTDWNFKTADATAPIFITPQAARVENIYDLGFDLSARVDETGTIYYLIIDQSSTDPVNVNEIFDPITNYVGGPILASGTISVIVPNEYHYASISSLSANTNFKVWLVAEDNVPNKMILIGEATSVTGTTTAPSPAGVVVDAPNVTICFGDAQPILPPINIREGTNADFSSGNNQTLNLVLPSGFEFDITSIPQITLSGSDIVNGSVSFINNIIMQIKYDITGTGARDKITIQGLYIKANTNIASGNVIRLGGTAIQNDNAESDNIIHASLGVIPLTTANFTFDTGSSSVGNNQLPVTLLPNASLLSSGTNTFSGTAVFVDKFYPDIAPIGDHNITLVHLDEFGCTSSLTKVITVFDNVSAIPGVLSKYCSGALVNVFIGENDKSGFSLTNLVLDVSNYPGKEAFTGGLVLTQSGNNYTFDIDLAGKNLNQGTVFVDLVATYVNKLDASDIQTFTKPVTISDPPTVLLNLAPGFSGPLNANDFCKDGEDVLLQGVYDKTVHTSVTNLFEFVPIHKNGILINSGDENASFSPNDLIDSLGYGAHILKYELTNTNTGCSNSDTLTITVNEKPIANFEVIDQNGFSNPLGIKGCVFENGNENTTIFNSTSTIGSGSITGWIWNFDDPDNSNTINPDEALTEITSHNYPDQGTYSVELLVTTDIGCESDELTKELEIGNNPTPQFTYSNIGISEGTTLTINDSNLGISNSETIISIDWSINERDSNPSSEINLPGDQYIYSHPFTSLGSKDISLTLTTNLNCITTISDSLFIVPIEVLTNGTNYTALFEDNSDGWVTWGINNSWIRSTTGGGDVITSSSGTNGGSSFWVTQSGNNVAYNENQESYVYSPIFDFTDLDRPLVKFDMFDNMSSGKDGVVLEYSTTGFGTNPISESSWTIVGNLNSGINWYETRDISNSAGRINDTNKGWSLGSNDWKNARNTLTNVTGLGRVQFRIAFKSGPNVDHTLDGFAFDNFFIGQRTRTVLVENFTNANGDPNIIEPEATLLNSLAGTGNAGTELIVINYHTDFPGKNDLNEANRVDPSARTLYYDISAIPRAVIDGNIAQDALFSEWGEGSFDLRTLSLANFNIEIVPTTSEGALNIATAITPKILPLAGTHIIVMAAILDNSVTIDSKSYQYVLRKLLPNAAGIRIETATLNKDVELNLDFSWIPNNVFDPSNLSVVVFIQDEETKEIYQAEIIDLPTPALVTGNDELKDNLFTLYPNPANDQLTILLSQDLQSNSTLKIYDNFGKVVFEHAVSETQLILDTQEYASGMYHVQLTNDNEVIRKRLIISHSDR